MGEYNFSDYIKFIEDHLEENDMTDLDEDYEKLKDQIINE